MLLILPAPEESIQAQSQCSPDSYFCAPVNVFPDPYISGAVLSAFTPVLFFKYLRFLYSSKLGVGAGCMASNPISTAGARIILQPKLTIIGKDIYDFIQFASKGCFDMAH